VGVENLPRTIEILTKTAEDGFDRAVLRIIDQRKLPAEKKMVVLTDYRQVIDAVKSLAVRGAPALGVTGAAALAMWAVNNAPGTSDVDGFRTSLNSVANEIATARPTAVNLSWGVDRALHVILDALQNGATVQMAAASGLTRAKKMEAEDEECNRAIGKAGAPLLPEGARVLTHCNAGSLATVFYGTALGVVYAAHAQGRISHVYCAPGGTGGAPDGMGAYGSGHSMHGGMRRHGRHAHEAGIRGRCHRGCGPHLCERRHGEQDRYIFAGHRRRLPPHSVLRGGADVHHVNLDEGAQIPIEFRDPNEVCDVTAYPRNVYNPAFDVTPAELINGIITERGVIRPAVHESGALYNLRKFMSLKDVL